MGSKRSVTLIFIRIVFLSNLLLWQQLGSSGSTFNNIGAEAPVPSEAPLCYYHGQRLNCDEVRFMDDIIDLLSPKSYRNEQGRTSDRKSSEPNISCSDNTDAQIKCFCDNTGECFINEINLSDNQLTGTIPTSLSDLKELVKLDLSSNELTGSIPDPLILPKSEVLDLSYNQLTGPIPKSLGDCKNLNSMNLTKNNLTGYIPDLSSLSKLKELRFSYNQLTGPIPKSLGDCKNLNSISLAFNFLNGSIPEALGELSSSLTFLSLWSNLLSGQIPDALGKLHNLTILYLDDNNLSGKLPEALGDLSNLQHLWLTSNNFHGTIPTEYRRLRDLRTFSVGGNYLSGAIPDYIGKWTNLSYLNLLGNDFTGNLSAGIFNLPYLTELRASDISNPGISFPKQANMKSIATLILRNCLINGPIPDYIGNWKQLTYLDLSFNNLVGGIPNSLQNLSYLILTRNNLNGTLPSWITNNQNQLEADLTYNNFNLNGSSCSKETNCFGPSVKIHPNRTFKSDLAKKCHQKNTTSLFINCGGEQVAVGNHRYLDDTATSSFYENSSDHWAYSSCGSLLDNVRNINLVGSVTCDVSVPESDLYKDYRAAPVSLTYYAFCLEKGEYHVTLHFAETLYSKQEDDSIKGKRVFDVYIQEIIRLKDFDIKAKAGKPNKQCEENFTATVGKDGVLEIYFYWAGKGSTFNPPYLHGPLISAISITHEVSKKKLSALEIAGITLACALFLLLLFAFMWWIGWIGDREFRRKEIKLGAKVFSLKEIIDATQKFSPNKKIGEGRLGTVYKAELAPDLTIAVKKLCTPSTPKEKEEFAKAMIELANEVYAMRNLDLKNENLVQLLAGYSKKGLHLLIYEYMELKSLGKALFDQNSTLHLNWPTRYNICKGIAKGLKHLHERPQQIIHRNIKANNILLDANYNAKISDFGLAKLYGEENPFSFIEAGKDTGSYMAPEYAIRKAVTVKIDVYSFGVLLLEIVSGRNNAEYRENQESVFLLDTACNLRVRGRLMELVDERSRPYDWDQANTVLKLAMMCIDISPSLRPTMSQVVSVLEGEKPLEEITKEITHSTTRSDG